MPLPSRLDRYSVLPTEAVRERGGVLSFFGSQKREGGWEVPRHLRVACCMGSVELDLREAILSEGDTVIEVIAFMGSVEILLPPGVRVDMEGDALVGEYTFTPDPTALAPRGAPRIILQGNAILASVEAESRYAGERKRDAQRRVKAARRQVGSG
ncbi:MAG: hypothetical protein H7066_14810 [Cytophagaceae bacterium]|nr:hypothetical protein [Gemmatimonadaceae bacterium]